VTQPSEPRVRVLLCGEPLRGDDGAAIRAGGLLPVEVKALAEVLPLVQLTVEALLDIPNDMSVVIADAAVGVPPGRTVVLPLELVAQPGGAAPASSHSMPPPQVLALAGEMRGSLPRGVFVGVGGADFGFGERLSPAVEEGMGAFVEALVTAIRTLAAEARDGAAGSEPTDR
jgi:hydrogenase maturation protease